MLVTITIKIGEHQKTLTNLSLSEASDLLFYMAENTSSGRRHLYKIFETEFKEYNKTALLKATPTTSVPYLISKIRDVK